MMGLAARSASGAAGAVLAGAVVLLAAAGPFVAPYDPNVFVGAPFQPATHEMLLGADVLGRDVLSRLLCGGYRILLMSLLATVLGVSGGAILGMVAGYWGGRADELIMRTLDVALAFPQMILALLLLSIMGSEPWLVIAVVAAIHLPQVARVMRAATLRVTGEDYIQHARAIGMARGRVLFSQILPNVSTPLLVEFGLRIAYSIALISALNFLDLGQQPPTPDWGLMINENRIGLAANAWPVVAPVLLIALLTIGVNLMADAISHAQAEGAPGSGLRHG